MSDYIFVPPRCYNPEICVERVFENGFKNPRFDPKAMPAFQPKVYRSAAYISEENPAGAFPSPLSTDYVLAWVADYTKRMDPDPRRSGVSLKVFFHAAKIVRANITFNDETFRKVIVLNGQVFRIDIPGNPYRPLDTNELATLVVKKIGKKDSDKTVTAPPESACTICIKKFVPGAKVIKLICGHMFYKSCIKAWLKRTGNCPNCKSVVRKADLGGASVRTRTVGTFAGGVLGLSDELLTRMEDEDDITHVACSEFEDLCNFGRHFPLIKTTNFTVLPTDCSTE